jgi:exodeoxyribonuclease V alpha subunit
MNEQQVDTEQKSLTEYSLRGEVSRVVYENAENGYSVVKVTDLQGVEHTVVGMLSGAYRGQGLEVTGNWETHPEHGRQLRANEFKFTLPVSVEGIKRYLSSGVIPGIGPKLADCIVDRFGGHTLEIMDNYSSRLKEIPGFGRKRVSMIKKAWEEHSARRNILIFMQGLGISPVYCTKIYKVFGDNAAEQVKADPYRLAEEVSGIGFIMSDRIASSLGIKGNDPQRVRSGVGYALSQLTQSGHVCYPEEDFVRYTAELLAVDEEDVRNGIRDAVNAGKAIVDGFTDRDGFIRNMIYDASLFEAEKELPRLINRLARVKRHSGTSILNIKPPQEMYFSEEQLAAVEAVGRYPLSIITGGPGVGKTTVVGEIVRRAVAAKLNIYMAAPTGRAAKRLSESTGRNAATIHRMLKWEPAEKKFIYGNDRKLPCDVLIVDEVSMLDLPLALSVFKALKPSTTVVLVGDADQLPSVGPGTVLHDLIKSRLAAVTHLSKIFRQGEGSRIILNAHRVNSGHLPETVPEDQDKSRLADFYWIEQDEPEQVNDLILRMIKNRIPTRFGFDPMRDIQVLSPMNRGVCGTKTLNQQLQQELNAGHKPQFSIGDKIFKAGDRVMQIRNNYDKNVFNGDMGRVVNVNSADKLFTVKFDNIPVIYEFSEADQLNLAYAVTVHKSQGSEFPVVILPMLTQHYMMLQRNLLYTAMTRARRLLILIGSRKAVSMAVRNATLEPRYSMLLYRLRKTANE